MEIFISKDNPSNLVSAGLTIEKRQLKTYASVKNGETLILDGIKELMDNNKKTSVPILSDIPLIGFLFTNNETSQANRELVVFITPEIKT